MGTYAQPGITQGQVTMAEQADYASGLSKTLKTARTSMDNQMAMIETSKNALAKQTAELMQEANKIQSSDNSELADSFKQTIIDQIDALDLLEYNSIGRDQTEVTKMRSNLLNGVEGATSNFMKLLAEAEDYNKRVVNGTSPKTVSNTNSNPKAIPFLNALGVNGGKQVKTDWDGLGFNLSYKDPNTGKEFKINPTNYYAGREQGLPGLWNEVQDPSPTFKASYDQLAKNFPNINKVTESRGANGELITTTSLDSEKAYDNIRNGILNDKIIRNGINGDTMQFLSGSGYYDKGIDVTYDPENRNQENELMEAIANYTMAQYSKGKGEQVRDIRTQLAKTKTKSTKESKGEESEYSFKPDVDGIIKGISDLKNDPEKGQTYFIGKKIKGREIIEVKYSPEDSTRTFITRSTTAGGKIVDKEETYNLNNTNSINNLEDDLIKTIIGTNRDSQKARDYAHNLTKSLISGEEDFSLPKEDINISIEEWKDNEESLVGDEDEDSESYKKGVLYQFYPDFTFEQTGFGTDKVIATSPNGENKTKALSTGNKDDYKILIEFIEKNSNKSNSLSISGAGRFNPKK